MRRVSMRPCFLWACRFLPEKKRGWQHPLGLFQQLWLVVLNRKDVVGSALLYKVVRRAPLGVHGISTDHFAVEFNVLEQRIDMSDFIALFIDCALCVDHAAVMSKMDLPPKFGPQVLSDLC